MKHRPWPYTQRLVERLADSSLMDAGLSIKRDKRSDGLHASTLLRAIHPPKKNDIDEDQLAVFAIGGLAFEDRVETALLSLAGESDWPYNAWRPGEADHDGVTCSPDVLLLPKGDDTYFEMSIKMTWKSCKDCPTKKAGVGGFPPKFDYYLDQCMTYGTPLNTLESVLLVYFVNGDYKSRIPQIHGWHLEFTERERAETWAALMNMKKQRKL